MRGGRALRAVPGARRCFHGVHTRPAEGVFPLPLRPSWRGADLPPVGPKTILFALKCRNRGPESLGSSPGSGSARAASRRLGGPREGTHHGGAPPRDPFPAGPREGRFHAEERRGARRRHPRPAYAHRSLHGVVPDPHRGRPGCGVRRGSIGALGRRPALGRGVDLRQRPPGRRRSERRAPGQRACRHPRLQPGLPCRASQRSSPR